MRVVVTGATGNVGTSLLERLAADSQIRTVVGVARRPTDWRPPGADPGRVDIVSADVSRDSLDGLFLGADAVVHLEWAFQPTHDPEATWQSNVVGSQGVFDAVRSADVPVLVHASSVGAYSPSELDRPVDEGWATHSLPTASYGREKAYVERLLDRFEADHPDRRVVRLRPGFIFEEAAASEQRRIFGGPFIPGTLARPRFLPVFPWTRGLRFQALHSRDAAEAFHLALVRDVAGAFNVAAEPVIDEHVVGQVLGARPLYVPAAVLRRAAAAAWHLHLVPASPELVDLVLRLPVMDVSRAHDELGWRPEHSAIDALEALLSGVREGEGGATPPLEPDEPGARLQELATGVGERDLR